MAEPEVSLPTCTCTDHNTPACPAVSLGLLCLQVLSNSCSVQLSLAMPRYPQIVEDVIEEEEQTVNGVNIPIDTSQPNPNGTEFDNLYLVCDAYVHMAT